MATFTVTTAADVVNAGDGRLSLREAVAQANATTATDAIVFATNALEGATLVLTGGELVVSRDLRIDGDANNDGLEVTLSGGDAQRLLRTSGGGTDLALQDLTLADGLSGGADGGGIFVGGGNLVLTSCTVRDCSGAYGGGIFVGVGSLALTGCTVRNCYANWGAGIRAEGSSRVTLTNSSITDNYSDGGGGISAGGDVALVVRGSQISGNGTTHQGSAIHQGGLAGAREQRLEQELRRL
jgi:hypothetical protein